MRRVIAIAVAGMGLAGCSSFSLDAFKSTPPTIQVQLDLIPSGADAKTSLGPGCKTPCSVAVPTGEAAFTVTYTMNKFLPVTVPVQVIITPGDFTTPASITVEPSPVFAELKPAGPPPKVVVARRRNRKSQNPHRLTLQRPRHRRSRLRRRLPLRADCVHRTLCGCRLNSHRNVPRLRSWRPLPRLPVP